MIVLDTATLLYWASNLGELSTSAVTAITESDRIIICSMSIWEIGWKVKRGKLTLPTSARELAIRLTEVDKIEIAAVDTETWLRNVALDWAHRDPADRTIVATADLRGCPLVTPDRKMQEFYTQAIW